MKDFPDRINRQTTSHNHYHQLTRIEQKDQSQETIESIVAKILFVLGSISKGLTGTPECFESSRQRCFRGLECHRASTTNSQSTICPYGNPETMIDKKDLNDVLRNVCGSA
jgi:hypothetical protein